MSRTKPVLPAVLILVALATSTAAYSASTDGGAAVSIQIHPTTFSSPQIGTWEATGGITDSGTYERTGGHTTSIPDCFCQPEHAGAFAEELLLAGSQGTLTVKAEEKLKPTG